METKYDINKTIREIFPFFNFRQCNIANTGYSFNIVIPERYIKIINDQIYPFNIDGFLTDKIYENFLDYILSAKLIPNCNHMVIASDFNADCVLKTIKEINIKQYQSIPKYILMPLDYIENIIEEAKKLPHLVTINENSKSSYYFGKIMNIDFGFYNSQEESNHYQSIFIFSHDINIYIKSNKIDVAFYKTDDIFKAIIDLKISSYLDYHFQKTSKLILV